MCWLMLLRVSTVLKREANTRCLLGRAHHPSRRQVSNSDDEAWLHWRIWNHQWSQGCENCEPRGRLNKGGVFRPRFDVHLRDLEKWQNNLLPSRQLGFTAWKPHLASWTMKKRDKNTQEGKYLDSFSRDAIQTNKMSQRTKEQLFLDFFLGKLDQITYSPKVSKIGLHT